MLAVVGTVPDNDFPLVAGEVAVENDHVHIRESKIPINRGTSALIAASVKACEVLKAPNPFVYLVGDIGRGDGSRRLYDYLSHTLAEHEFDAIAFHYLQPDVDWHNRVLFAVQEMAQKPTLIADAGFMYAAKMSGQSAQYDLFTPDVGELAFLADEQAPHPFYTRGFILHEDFKVPELIKRAYQHKNAARYILIKGQPDYVASEDGIQAIIDEPIQESLEAIGGTGDTLTGIVTALVTTCLDLKEAAIIAARANRLAGQYARPTPATQVMHILNHIPDALAKILKDQDKFSKKSNV